MAELLDRDSHDLFRPYRAAAAVCPETADLLAQGVVFRTRFAENGGNPMILSERRGAKLPVKRSL
jgi:hypothetical protein